MSEGEKTYKAIDKLNVVGEKLGLTLNRKVTLLGKVVATVVMVLFFGVGALVGSFFRGMSKK
jgi:hypothetical protein